MSVKWLETRVVCEHMKRPQGSENTKRAELNAIVGPAIDYLINTNNLHKKKE